MLGNTIKELRRNKHITQKDLAKLMNVSQQTVGAWETGRAIPGSDTLGELADLFNVSTDYLLGRNTQSKADKVHNMSVDEALGTIMSFEGQPVTDHDKKVMKDILESYLRNKE